MEIIAVDVIKLATDVFFALVGVCAAGAIAYMAYNIAKLCKA